MGFLDLLKLSIGNPEVYMEIVKKDSQDIPMSIRMFLGDAIRNAMCVSDKQKMTNRINSALREVGI